MKIKGDVTTEMGMEAYAKVEYCKWCRAQVLIATTSRGMRIELDVRGTYKDKPGRPGGLWSCYYDVNPLTGKLIDGVQRCQQFDPEHDKTGWRVHVFTCPDSMAAIADGQKVAEWSKNRLEAAKTVAAAIKDGFEAEDKNARRR